VIIDTRYDTRSTNTFIAPKDLIEEVDRLVGPRRRSEFLTEAAAEKLQREKLLRFTREVMKLPPAEGIPEWETPESTSKWVHDGRIESDRARNL
jgi:hypothetical protein